jgi:hypothetical protein
LEMGFTLRNALLVSFESLFSMTWWSWVDDGIISLEKIRSRKSWNCPITWHWRSRKWRQWFHHISTTTETKACCTKHKEKRWAHCPRAGFLEPCRCLLGKASEWLGSYLDGPVVEIVCLSCFPASRDQLLSFASYMDNVILEDNKRFDQVPSSTNSVYTPTAPAGQSQPLHETRVSFGSMPSASTSLWGLIHQS